MMNEYNGNDEIPDDDSNAVEGSAEKKLVSIMTFGSRGDIQPFVGAALELSKKYRVRLLSTTGSSKSFAESFGLTFVEIFPQDPSEFIQTNDAMRKSMAEGNVMKFFEGLEELNNRSTAKVVHNFIEEMNSNRPDLLITGSLVEYFEYYARRVLKLNVLPMALQSTGYSPDHAPWGVPKLPFGLHYYIMRFAISQNYKNIQRFDEEMLKLEGKTLSMTKKEFENEVQLTIKGFAPKKVICQSSLFRTILWPDAKRYIYTGPCIIDAESQKKYNEKFGGDDTHERISDFLIMEENKIPVYLGWGSMLGNTPEAMVVMAVKALMLADERGIILGGNAGLSFELLCKASDDQAIIAYAKKNVLFVTAASHEWLFPLVKCIVHHGGSGTTQSSLRSGVPTIVTPNFMDQFCHSRVVNELGVGKGFSVGMQKLTYEDIGSAIKSVQTEEIIKRCEEVSIHIRRENGNANVARVVEELLNEGDNSADSSSSQKPIVQSSYILPELVVGSMKLVLCAYAFQLLLSVVLINVE